jgi:hypothetical protein
MRCGVVAERTAFALAKGLPRFNASSRRSSERVPPVNRASSGSFGKKKLAAVSRDGTGLGKCICWLGEVGGSWGSVLNPGKEAWIRAILLAIVAICPSCKNSMLFSGRKWDAAWR